MCIASPDGDIGPALDFASNVLAPRAPTSPDYLEELESTMALLIFPHDDLTPPLAALLDPELRRSVANRVNEAVLVDQGSKRDSHLRNLIRLRAWTEDLARKTKRDIPESLGIGLDLEEEATAGENDVIMRDHEHGDDTESL